MNDDLKAQDWLEQLQSVGCRITAPRRAIVDILLNSERALSPSEIYDISRERIKGMGLVTVYRTLETLEELGLVQRVHQPQGCQAFVPVKQGHNHLLLCSHCNRYAYFTGEDLEAFFEAAGGQYGYRVTDHWLQLFGLCQACQGTAAGAEHHT
ncbi:MAG: transcriptional repressor [Anaerolineae bacterium]|nr:transcriptional repressor [Anaerolineae bacterium]